MSFELERKLISVYEPLKSETLKTVVNADIIVPDTKPDVVDILEVNSLATIREKYIQKDKICVSGIILYTVLYCGDTANGTLRSIRYKMPFSEQMELVGAREDMDYYAECQVTHSEHRVENSRKISVRSVLSLDCGAVMRKKLNTISSMPGENEIPCKVSKISVLNMEVCQQNTFSVNDSFSIPEKRATIDEILKTDVKISKNEQKIMNGKLVVKGTVLCDTLYTIEGDIYHVQNECPYTEVIDADDVTPEMRTEVSYRLHNAEFELSDLEEETVINASIDVQVLIKAFSENEHEIVSDAYCPDYAISLSEELCAVYSVDESFREVYSMNEVVRVEDGAPSIVKVYNVCAQPVLDSVIAQNGYVQHEGHVDVKMLYRTDSESRPVCSLNKQIPFSIRIKSDKATMDSKADSSVVAEHISYVLKSDKSFEVRLSLGFDGKTLQRQLKNFITEININEDEPLIKKEQAGITIYFADSGEELWNIAKRYNTTVEEISKVNEIDASKPLKTKQQLLIPKRVVM